MFCALVLAAVIYRGGSSTLVSTVTVGIVTAVIGFAISHVRFRWFAPRRITADDAGLRIISRSGREISIRWDEIKSGKHGTTLGMEWILESSTGRVVIRDDGFGGDAWRDFSALLCRQLEKHGVPMAVDFHYKVTVEK